MTTESLIIIRTFDKFLDADEAQIELLTAGIYSRSPANIARADLERSRVYLSLRANSALEAIQLYTKAVGDPKVAAQGLKGVIAHRLLRVLCSNCKVAYPPTPDMLKKLGLPPDQVTQLFKKGGQVLVRNKPEVCPVCNGVGYMGHGMAANILKGGYPLQVMGRRNRAPVEDLVAKGATEKLRPGMEGVGKIQVDERKLIWIWTHKLVHWMRMWVWSWWP